MPQFAKLSQNQGGPHFFYTWTGPNCSQVSYLGRLLKSQEGYFWWVSFCFFLLKIGRKIPSHGRVNDKSKKDVVFFALSRSFPKDSNYNKQKNSSWDSPRGSGGLAMIQSILQSNARTRTHAHTTHTSARLPAPPPFSIKIRSDNYNSLITVDVHCFFVFPLSEQMQTL